MDLAGRLSDLGHQGLTDRALRAEQLQLIAALVRFDDHVFAMTDPSTGVITSPHATIPMISQSDLPGLIRRRYAAGGVRQWHAILAEFGVRDAVTVALNDRWGTWGFLELWRGDARFSEHERGQLSALAPALTASLRMAVARTFTMPQAGSARLDDRIAVHIGPSTTAERVDLFARSSQLTSRENEVLRLALHGLDTRAMANELVIAHTTTEDHLKALLAKTGSATRHQLLARALGG